MSDQLFMLIVPVMLFVAGMLLRTLWCLKNPFQKRRCCHCVSYVIFKEDSSFSLGYQQVFSKKGFDTNENFEELLEHLAVWSGAKRENMVILSITKL